MATQIWDDADLNAEHDALQYMADVMAKKWKGDLEEAECSYSLDGLISQFDWWKDDIDNLKVLYDLHKKRIKAYREAKKDNSPK